MNIKKVEWHIGRKMVGVEEGLKFPRTQVEHGLHWYWTIPDFGLP